jgi:hypothetical protein
VYLHWNSSDDLFGKGCLLVGGLWLGFGRHGEDLEELFFHQAIFRFPAERVLIAHIILCTYTGNANGEGGGGNYEKDTKVRFCVGIFLYSRSYAHSVPDKKGALFRQEPKEVYAVCSYSSLT